MRAVAVALLFSGCVEHYRPSLAERMHQRVAPQLPPIQSYPEDTPAGPAAVQRFNYHTCIMFHMRGLYVVRYKRLSGGCPELHDAVVNSRPHKKFLALDSRAEGCTPLLYKFTSECTVHADWVCTEGDTRIEKVWNMSGDADMAVGYAQLHSLDKSGGSIASCVYETTLTRPGDVK